MQPSGVDGAKGGAVEALSLVGLTSADVQGGLALSSAAGWNQTAADWTLFVEQGHAVGYRTASGSLIGTGAALTYRGGYGWVSMVLVSPPWRHRGLASLMLDDCVRYLQAANSTPVLDATPLGAPVYRHRGFRPAFEFERWERRPDVVAGALPETGSVRAGTPSDLDVVAALDQAASGIGRRALLKSMIGRSDSRLWLAVDGSGFVLARAGATATQVGPLVAPDPTAAVALLSVAVASTAGPLFLDVPTRWADLATWLEAHSFVRQRSFLRMALDAPRPLVCSDRMFVLAGPEFG